MSSMIVSYLHVAPPGTGHRRRLADERSTAGGSSRSQPCAMILRFACC